jgi:hypothetical protein
MLESTDGGVILRSMNTSKITGFVQGAFYPVVGALLLYVSQNLGASGLVSSGTAVIICGILSVIENAIQAKTGNALFGLAN